MKSSAQGSTQVLTLDRDRRDAQDSEPALRAVPSQPSTAPRLPSERPARADGDLDRFVRAAIARATVGRSPLSLWLAWADWLGHLSIAPALQRDLIATGIKNAVRLGDYACTCALRGSATEPCAAPLPQDKRFVDPAWSLWPFNVIHQGFLLQQAWWDTATTTVPGVSRHNAQQMAFVMRQLLDVLSPGNFVATIPLC